MDAEAKEVVISKCYAPQHHGCTKRCYYWTKRGVKEAASVLEVASTVHRPQMELHGIAHACDKCIALVLLCVLCDF